MPAGIILKTGKNSPINKVSPNGSLDDSSCFAGSGAAAAARACDSSVNQYKEASCVALY